MLALSSESGEGAVPVPVEPVVDGCIPVVVVIHLIVVGDEELVRRAGAPVAQGFLVHFLRPFLVIVSVPQPRASEK